MARARIPVEKAKVSGADVKNPQRHRNRKVPKGFGPVGSPPKHLTFEQKAAWKQFVKELPWLNSFHRALLEAACILRVRMQDTLVGVNQIQTYSSILSKLGATPADESKVSLPDTDDEDPDDEFYDRGSTH